MVLDAREWVALLSSDYPPSKERVVYVSRFRNPLSIRKDARAKLGFSGGHLRPGKEVELATGGEDAVKVAVPDWAVEQLGLVSGVNVCITAREGHHYLKRLDLVEQKTCIPGTVILDTFGDTVVTRNYASMPDLDRIQPAELGKWLTLMGQLKHDPLAPFRHVEGTLGLLARKVLLGWSAVDRELAQSYRQQLVNGQLENGSWDGNVLGTAANLIRLIEFGADLEDNAIRRASQWLLDLPEPEGLSGLFLVSEGLAQRFNQWKAKPGAKGRPHRRESKGELRGFFDHVDYATNYALDACELRLTWTTALVLEALLRCGLHDEPRVLRSLGTLFALSGHGGWCGCGYLDAKVNVLVREGELDWNPAPTHKNAPHNIDWFPEEKDILQPVFDGRWEALEVGPRKAFLVKSWHNTGLCTMVMHRALSYHPQYRGSTLEAMGALRLAYCQSAYGTWGEMVYLSSMMGFLSRMTNPLAAFLVLRSVPWLIREQGTDGLWREAPVCGITEGQPQPTREESSYLILRALKQFGFLDILYPQ